MRDFLEEKYGKYITDQLLNEKNEAIQKNCKKVDIIKEKVNDQEQQDEVIKVLKASRDVNGNNLVPDFFWNKSVKWGFDFSSWIGNYNSKDYFFIGAEPHIHTNFQLVYDFGNYEGKNLKDTALMHYGRETDIWHYLTNIFVDEHERTDEKITEFLNKCYITDLCHMVPQGCGQVKEICKELSIKGGDWKKFRSNVAKRYLLKEIEAVNPKFVILHGNPSREFFQTELGLKYYIPEFEIEKSKYTIKIGKLNGYKIISIPHLKGDVRNKLWKCKEFPERLISAKKELNDLISNPTRWDIL